MRTLYCDPTQNNTVTLRYGDCPGTCVREENFPQPFAEHVLQLITNMIRGEGVDQIVLVNQAQSFTLIRTLATICNALAYSLSIPVYSLDAVVDWDNLSSQLTQPVAQIVPQYSAQPKITVKITPKKIK